MCLAPEFCDMNCNSEGLEMKMHAIVFSAVIWYFSARNVFWYVVIQLVEALHYKPEGHSFNS